MHELKLWDVIRVSPTVARAFEGGPDGIEFVAIGADRPEGGDGELIPDFWSGLAPGRSSRAREVISVHTLARE